MEVARKPRTVTISYQSGLCCFEPFTYESTTHPVYLNIVVIPRGINRFKRGVACVY